MQDEGGSANTVKGEKTWDVLEFVLKGFSDGLNYKLRKQRQILSFSFEHLSRGKEDWKIDKYELSRIMLQM